MKRSFFLFVVVMQSFGVAMGNSKRDWWESSHYIWNFGIIAQADKGTVSDPEQYFALNPHFNAILCVRSALFA